MTPGRRTLGFDGAVNFRDVGGYPVESGRRTRWGRLYRADDLAGLTDLDLMRLSELRLRTLIDFRVDAERTLKANRLPKDSGIRTVSIAFLDEATLELLSAIAHNEVDARGINDGMMAQYRRFVTDHAPEYKAMIGHLVDAQNFPILLHCTSGKDRTGFAIAVVLMAVGAERDTIVEDYLLTNAYRRDIRHLFNPKTTDEAADALTSAREAYIGAAFEQIHESYGSVDAYLERGLGLTEADRGSLRANLTEP